MQPDKVQNPANRAARVTDRTRIPMSIPRQKLSVPEIPGYYLYWMRGTPERLGQAQAGGYEFVSAGELLVNNMAVGGDASHDGSTDMGTRVSVIAGDEVGGDGQPVRLYLMKLKEEWHQEDLAVQESANDRLRTALLQGKIGAEQDKGLGDSESRYVGSQTSRNMFQPRPIRRT